MIKTYIILLISVLFVEFSFGQYAYFGQRGNIDFEKVTYTRARMKDMMNQNSRNRGRMMFYGGDPNNMPESETQKINLEFDEFGTVQKPLENTENSSKTPRMNNNNNNRGGGMRGNSMRAPRRASAGELILAQNLKNATQEIQLLIDNTYILQDSATKITWRFTDEYRKIAGMNCRRVNGATTDSLYLIAYYTDEIPVSGGPALTSGLPGMILGLVIPELHVQYWATAVNYSNDLVDNNWQEKKAKKMSITEFSTLMSRNLPQRKNMQSEISKLFEQLIY